MFPRKLVCLVVVLTALAALVVADRAGAQIRKYHHFYCPPREPQYIADSPVPSYFLPIWVRPDIPPFAPVGLLHEGPMETLPTPRVQKDELPKKDEMPKKEPGKEEPPPKVKKL